MDRSHIMDEWPNLNEAPSHNWRPGKPAVARKSVRHTIAGAMSMLRSVTRRDDFDLTDLAELAALNLPTELLADGVATLRRRGHSWAEVGAALGVKRETAFGRFAHLVDVEQ